MQKPLLFFIICSVLNVFDCQAYYPKQGNIWYFGENAGIDFNSVLPVPLTNSAMLTIDNSSAISDQSGNLLFYSDGSTVWNKNHQIMNNGTGLLGNQSGGQCALIVPQPENAEYYYLFTTSEFASGAGFCYNKISMSQPAGLGSVIEKNRVLISPATEKIACIYNFNQNFWWVVAHQWGNNKFNAYKLTALGLDTVPVVSSVGTVHSGGSYGFAHNAVGQMNFAPHGNKLATALYLAGLYEILDFDINTGVISNPIVLPGNSDAFGIEFSPNSKKVYTSQLNDPEVYQYDLTAGSATAIQNSKTLVGTLPSTGSYRGGYMSLAPDSQLYIAYYYGTSLAVIEKPDLQPAAVNFMGSGFHLGGKVSSVGICTNIYKQAHISIGIEEDLEVNVKIFPNPTQDYARITFLNSNFTPEYISLYDAKSQLISRQSYSTSTDLIINLKDRPAGIYFVEITNKSIQRLFTLVKE